MTHTGPWRLYGDTPYSASSRALGEPWETAPGRVSKSKRPHHRPHKAAPDLVESHPPLGPAGGPHQVVPRCAPGASSGDGLCARHRSDTTESPWHLATGRATRHVGPASDAAQIGAPERFRDAWARTLHRCPAPTPDGARAPQGRNCCCNDRRSRQTPITRGTTSMLAGQSATMGMRNNGLAQATRELLTQLPHGFGPPGEAGVRIGKLLLQPLKPLIKAK